MNIVFLGDVSLNGHYNKMYKQKEKVFNVDFSNVDYVVGNIECLAEGVGENLLKNPRLKTNVSTLNLLKGINLNIALLAHNHVYDNLRQGFDDTIDFFDKNGILSLGTSVEKGLESEPIILREGDISVCLLNYVTTDTNPNLPNECDVYLNWFEENKVICDIKRYKEKCDYVVLLLHWGGKMEGAMLPDFDQVGLAHRLVDAGVDLIVGNHSHTIQPYEIYKGKYIYYSLGNFCFSDDFSIDGKCLISMDLIRYRYSRVLDVKLTEKQLVLKSYYSYRDKLNNVYLTKKTRLALLLYQNIFNLVFSRKFFWNIYRKLFKLYQPINRLFFDRNEKIRDFILKCNINQMMKYLKK